jgi:radical SAM superfamily enzyme YgiQ (UPF0313 family)
MLKYEGIVIRPPSEAESLIFQVTLGCSDNNCIFCPAYKNKSFKIKEFDQIEKEFKQASVLYPHTRRIFLADGDAIIIEQKKLVKILKIALFYFPKLTRIGVYGSAKTLQTKTLEDLKELKKNKLGIIYLGIETGDPEVYELIKKYGTPDIVIQECMKIKESGIKLNTTVILGLGGTKRSKNHAINTANILNKIKPDQIALLTLMVKKNTLIYKMIKNKEFLLLNKIEVVQEMYLLLTQLEEFSCLFFSNHASNYLPINARFPRDKNFIIDELKQIINNEDESMLKSELFRNL